MLHYIDFTEPDTILQGPTGSPGSRDFPARTWHFCQSRLPAGTCKMAGNFGWDFYKIVLDFDLLIMLIFQTKRHIFERHIFERIGNHTITFIVVIQHTRLKVAPFVPCSEFMGGPPPLPTSLSNQQKCNSLNIKLICQNVDTRNKLHNVNKYAVSN